MKKIITKQRQQRIYQTVSYKGQNVFFSAGFIKGTQIRKRALNIVHKHLSLLYLISGKGEYTDWQGRKFDLLPGDLALRIPGKKHSIVREDSLNWLEFYITLPDYLHQFFIDNGFCREEETYLKIGFPEEIFSEIDNCFDLFDANSLIETPLLLSKIQHLFFQFLSFGHQQNTPGTPNEKILKKACFILEQSLEKRLDMRKVAKECGCGYEAFRKLFRQENGMSLKQFRIKKRIEKARVLLQNQELEIKQIADMLGYQEAPAFVRQFKQWAETTPKTYRDHSVVL